VLNAIQGHVDAEIAVSPPKVVAPPPGDAVWSVVKFSRKWNGVPPPVSGVPPPEIAASPPKVVVPPSGNDVSSPFGGKSLKLLPPEVRL